MDSRVLRKVAESRDGFPCNDEDQEVRDEFPRSEICRIRIFELYFGRYKYCIYRGFSRIGEKSERLRQSDFGVQIVPASRSPSELSAHQMGLSLAGTVD